MFHGSGDGSDFDMWMCPSIWANHMVHYVLWFQHPDKRQRGVIKKVSSTKKKGYNTSTMLCCVVSKAQNTHHFFVVWKVEITTHCMNNKCVVSRHFCCFFWFLKQKILSKFVFSPCVTLLFQFKIVVVDAQLWPKKTQIL